jgi:hypothetical protein
MNVLILFLYYEIFLIHIQDQINDFCFQVIVLLEELIDYLNLNTKFPKEKSLKDKSSFGIHTRSVIS